MRRMAVAVLMALAIGTESAIACQCTSIPEPSRALRDASAVFSGLVVSEKWKTQEKGLLKHEVRIKVDRAWKGAKAGQTIRVYTGQVCGTSFGKDKSYLVYATVAGEKHELWAGLCSRTMELKYVEGD